MEVDDQEVLLSQADPAYDFRMRYIGYLILLLITTAAISCNEPTGKCDQSEQVRFRGRVFRFPITGKEAMLPSITNAPITLERSWFGAEGTRTSRIYWYIAPNHWEYNTIRDTARYYSEAPLFCMG